MNDSKSELVVEFFCDYCGAEGWVLSPAQWSDEPRYEPCPLCHGEGVRIKRVSLDLDVELDDSLPADYDPFA